MKIIWFYQCTSVPSVHQLHKHSSASRPHNKWNMFKDRYDVAFWKGVISKSNMVQWLTNSEAFYWVIGTCLQVIKILTNRIYMVQVYKNVLFYNQKLMHMISGYGFRDHTYPLLENLSLIKFFDLDKHMIGRFNFSNHINDASQYLRGARFQDLCYSWLWKKDKW